MRPWGRTLAPVQVYEVLLDGVHPLAAKVLELGGGPNMREAFIRVSTPKPLCCGWNDACCRFMRQRCLTCMPRGCPSLYCHAQEQMHGGQLFFLRGNCFSKWDLEHGGHDAIQHGLAMCSMSAGGESSVADAAQDCRGAGGGVHAGE
jgi:hypothetical protein